MDVDKLKEVACLIQFVLLFDNNGKRIYTKYYTNKFGIDYLNDISSQKEFEKKLCITAQNFNVTKNEVDIFTINEFTIIAKITNEVAIFIGASENENECLVANFYSIFESVLLNMVNDVLSKAKLMEIYEQLAILIDEMITEGVIMNTNGTSLESAIYLKDGSSSTILSSSSSSYTGSYLFNSLLSGAKSYLSRSVNS